MKTSTLSRSRGFSLIELIVALGISLIVITGAIGLMVSQQRSFQSTAGDRHLQETARIALDHIGNNLRQAGFGVDLALVFDFGPMANVRMDRAYQAQTFSTTSYPMGNGNACGTLCRDSTTGPDEIVFYSRDPAFGPHPLTVAATNTSTSLRFAGPLNVTLLPGQILQVACYSGDMVWAYVQVAGSTTVNGDGTVTVPIVSGNGTTFPQQNAWLIDSCFSSVATISGGVVSNASLSTAAEVFKVDRYHYFIETFDTSGNVQPWGTSGARPYLMFDQGLTSNGTLVTSVIAPDVEDIQFAYVFPYDAVTPLVGATAGANITDDDNGINLAPANGFPAFSDPTTSLTRQNHDPGNIGAVEVSVVVRTADQDLTLLNSSTVPAAGNRAAVAGPTGYTRLLVNTTFAVRNLGALSPYFPTYGSSPAASGSRQLNVGGG
jgi:prepilin-type N-terminal cleavage/methylation domain-containing protein